MVYTGGKQDYLMSHFFNSLSVTPFSVKEIKASECIYQVKQLGKIFQKAEFTFLSCWS